MDRSGSLSAPASRLARDALLGTLQDLGRTSNIVVVRGVMDALLQIIRGLEVCLGMEGLFLLTYFSV